MKLTIKITDHVPYTEVDSVVEDSISLEDPTAIDYVVVKAVIERLRVATDRQVAEEMARRRIVLGEDGFMITQNP